MSLTQPQWTTLHWNCILLQFNNFKRLYTFDVAILQCTYLYLESLGHLGDRSDQVTEGWAVLCDVNEVGDRLRGLNLRHP